MPISFFPACHNLGVAPSFEPLGLSFPADLSAGEGSQGKETGHSSGAQVSPRFLFHPTQLRGGISCHFGSMRSFASVQWAFGENYSLGGFLFV